MKTAIDCIRDCKQVCDDLKEFGSALTCDERERKLAEAISHLVGIVGELAGIVSDLERK